MKRILSAAMVAIIFHVGLFEIDFGWFFDDTVVPPRSMAVTVTMSYRQPEPVVKKKKKSPAKPIVKPKKKPKPPEKKAITPPDVPEKIPIEPPDIPETHEAETEDLDEDELIEEVKDVEEFQEDSHGDDVANMQVVQEAIPLYKTNPPPHYPRSARRRGYQGTVMLSVMVNEKGHVEKLLLAESSGYRILDNAAIKAVRHWAFEPGSKGNKKVAMWVNVPIRYQIK